eukprot:GHVH01004298.1.p1 GENE.GHVH01004298.1~~GHVH01004298.1.p1  ORF type:complete len:562 (+),score=91.23 GHVH01004298.1:33-1718(+)
MIIASMQEESTTSSDSGASYEDFGSEDQEEYGSILCPCKGCGLTIEGPEIFDSHLMDIHKTDIWSCINYIKGIANVDTFISRMIVIGILNEAGADGLKESKLRDYSSTSLLDYCTKLANVNAKLLCYDEDQIDDDAEANEMAPLAVAEPIKQVRDVIHLFNGQVEPKSGKQVDCDRQEKTDLNTETSNISMLATPGTREEKEDTPYFDSYADLEIHRVMILDKVRTDAYRRALETIPGGLKGKVVLDVGCGSGILSMFASRCGAKKVVGLDAVASTLKVAKKLIHANGFGEDSITLVHGKVECMSLWQRSRSDGTLQVVGSPKEEDNAVKENEGYEPFKCDVLVSEWMGYALVYESMLPSVLVARDRYMKPSGTMLPNNCSLWLSMVNDCKEVETLIDDSTVWEKPMYGLNMNLLRPDLSKAIRKCHVRPVSGIVSDRVKVWSVDLNTCTVEDVTNIRTGVVSFNQFPNTQCSSICLDFDVDFDQVNLTTAAGSPLTHWNQSIMHLYDSNFLNSLTVQDPLTQLDQLKLNISPSVDNSRAISLVLEFKSDGVSMVCTYACD